MGFNRHSIRLPDYDYSQPGGYFVTIVTRGRVRLFGEIVDGEMRLSKMGRIVRYEWEKLPTRFPGVFLDEFVVMPNHLHGIISITHPVGATRTGISPGVGLPQERVAPDDSAGPGRVAPTEDGYGSRPGATRLEMPAGTGLPKGLVDSDASPGPGWVAPTEDVEGIRPGVRNAHGPMPGSIGAIMAQFKSKVTKRIQAISPGLAVWQRNCYEHVVRDEKDLDAIRAYICANPLRWNRDEENQP